MDSITDRTARGLCLACGLALSVSALTLFAGCPGASGPQTTTVQGRVTYQGQPVSQGYVSFLPTGPASGDTPSRPATGTLNPDGTYQLATFGENDGAIPGDYQVTIVSKTGGPSPEDPEAEEKWHIPQKYGTAADSGLTATIPADASGIVQLDFDLED